MTAVVRIGSDRETAPGDCWIDIFSSSSNVDLAADVGDRPLADTLDLAMRTPDYSVDAFLRALDVTKRSEGRSQTLPRSTRFFGLTSPTPCPSRPWNDDGSINNSLIRREHDNYSMTRNSNGGETYGEATSVVNPKYDDGMFDLATRITYDYSIDVFLKFLNVDPSTAAVSRDKYDDDS